MVSSLTQKRRAAFVGPQFAAREARFAQLEVAAESERVAGASAPASSVLSEIKLTVYGGPGVAGSGVQDPVPLGVQPYMPSFIPSRIGSAIREGRFEAPL